MLEKGRQGLVSASDAVQILRRQCCLGTGAKLKEEEQKKKVTSDDEGGVSIAPPPRMVLIIMTLMVMIDTTIVAFDYTFDYGL